MMKEPEFDPRPRGANDPTPFMWPRSTDPLRQRVYDHLREAGWRYDSHHHLFFEPISDTLKERFGRLEWGPNWPDECKIQPPSEVINGQPVRPQPLLVLHLGPGGIQS